MFDKKTILAFILIALIFIFWSLLWNPPAPPPAEEPAADSLAAEPIEMPDEAAEPEIAVDSTLPAVDTIPEQIIQLETDRYLATLSSRGGGLTTLQLKEHRYAENGGVYLIAEDNRQATPSLTSKSTDFSDSSILYLTEADESISLSGPRDSATITYTASLPTGASIVKQFTFYGDRYDFGLSVMIDETRRTGLVKEYVLTWLPGIPPSETKLAADYSSYRGGAYLSGDMYKFDSFAGDTLLLEDQPGNAEWVGSRSKYFCYAIIPQNTLSSGAHLIGRQKEVTTATGNYKARRIAAGIVMPITGRDQVDDHFKVYAGPLDYQVLRDYQANLEDFIDWGWGIIKPFSMAVYWVVFWLRQAIPNYGIVIILVSILLKVVTYPLTKKQLKSMKAMQALQPKIEELKQKYKDNPQKMNQAMMKLYKDEKVNPFGSCLFMLPQMPFLFGLYQVFRSTFELRQAYFLPLWPDLSQPDGSYIMPIIMAVAMFFQQKLAMTDPKHKMMVYLMPILFFFFFKGLPTGLVLYWTSFSVLSIIETLTIKRPERLQNPQVK